ncbi:hypothetical protein AB0N59_02840 [Microbacterium sp. NPDC089321]|uniref:VanZ family protein n=1 Tax=Microbacterium sp. NPDC089321 TaxID=3155183 RepID=UPI003448E9D7
MGEQVLLGALAIGIGVLAGIALFVPFVWISYRRQGRLSVPRTLMWFAALVYFCAYRFFDVGDLITNTSGALLGAVFGLVVPRGRRGLSKAGDALQSRPVTRGRRALAMLCDGLGFFFASATVSIAVQLFIGVVLHDRATMREGSVAELAGTGGAAVVWLAVTLITGQSVGDAAVQLRYTASRMPSLAARALRWLGGVAGLSALGLLGGVFDTLSGLLLFVACVLFFFTRLGRGLPGILSGQQLVDARAPQPVQDASARPSRQ